MDSEILKGLQGVGKGIEDAMNRIQGCSNSTVTVFSGIRPAVAWRPAVMIAAPRINARFFVTPQYPRDFLGNRRRPGCRLA